MIVLEIDVPQDAVLIDAEGQPPVPGDEQAPDALAVPGELMSAPPRRRLQFLDPGHILQEGEYEPQLLDRPGVHFRGVIVLEKPPKTFVDEAADLHGG